MEPQGDPALESAKPSDQLPPSWSPFCLKGFLLLVPLPKTGFSQSCAHTPIDNQSREALGMHSETSELSMHPIINFDLFLLCLTLIVNWHKYQCVTLTVALHKHPKLRITRKRCSEKDYLQWTNLWLSMGQKDYLHWASLWLFMGKKDYLPWASLWLCMRDLS